MGKTFGSKSTAEEVLAGLDLKGRRFLITGTSSGIGRETARALVARGARVIGAVTDVAAAARAMASVSEAALPHGGSLDLIQIDLGSLNSVRASAERLLADRLMFDAVIASAGVMATPFGRTVDGFERQFGVNHLGHFALINALAPLIEDGGRVVMLSSQAHRIADVDLDDPNFERQPYDPWLAYARSKTANALFAVEFDRRHSSRGIRAASVMPGNSKDTQLTRHLAAEDLQGLLDNVAKARVAAGLAPAELKDVPQAAATSVWAAAVADKDDIGGHYLEDCAVAPIDDTPNPFANGVRSYALDVEKARLLWAKSEQLTSGAR